MVADAQNAEDGALEIATRAVYEATNLLDWVDAERVARHVLARLRTAQYDGSVTP